MIKEKEGGWDYINGSATTHTVVGIVTVHDIKAV